MKNELPDYPLSLALVDLLPVIFFFVATLIVALRTKSVLFMAGSALAFAAGLVQVCWKLIIVLAKKNIWPLHAQMKFVMPLGFLLMLIALVLMRKNINWSGIVHELLSMPSLLFLILAVLCCVGMIVLAVTLGMKDGAKSQWIEEGVNVIFQASVMMCVLLTNGS